MINSIKNKNIIKKIILDGLTKEEKDKLFLKALNANMNDVILKYYIKVVDINKPKHIIIIDSNDYNTIYNIIKSKSCESDKYYFNIIKRNHDSYKWFEIGKSIFNSNGSDYHIFVDIYLSKINEYLKEIDNKISIEGH